MWIKKIQELEKVQKGVFFTHHVNCPVFNIYYTQGYTYIQVEMFLLIVQDREL
jgi:hypothetical protein